VTGCAPIRIAALSAERVRLRSRGTQSVDGAIARFAAFFRRLRLAAVGSVFRSLVNGAVRLVDQLDLRGVLLRQRRRAQDRAMSSPGSSMDTPALTRRMFDWPSVSSPKGNVARGAEGDFLFLGHRDICATSQRVASLPTFKPATENPAPLSLKVRRRCPYGLEFHII